MPLPMVRSAMTEAVARPPYIRDKEGSFQEIQLMLTLLQRVYLRF